MREYFPEKPSRQKAIFLSDVQSIPWWTQQFQTRPGPVFLLTVSCHGSLHRGSSEFLDSDTTDYLEYARRANSYWSEQAQSSEYFEYLFVEA